MFRWFQLAKRVSELEEQMLKLTRIVEDRDLDWVDMRARVKRMLDRTEKAAARATVGSPEDEEAAANLTPESSNGSRFTPRQKMIQQQVLRRRAGMS